VFLIRGSDLAGPATVRAWSLEASKLGAAKDIIDLALAQADRMDRYHEDVGAKVPDLPE
jgi:hypothetical protein